MTQGALAQYPVMSRCDQVAIQVEEIKDGGVDADELLRLRHGFESPCQQTLDVPAAQIEAVMEPDGVLDDLRGKSVALV